MWLLKLIMPKHFKEILIDVVFHKDNNNVELLARQLLKMKLINKNEKNFYEEV